MCKLSNYQQTGFIDSCKVLLAINLQRIKFHNIPADFIKCKIKVSWLNLSIIFGQIIVWNLYGYNLSFGAKGVFGKQVNGYHDFPAFDLVNSSTH